MESFVMRYGKYKGVRFASLPLEYLLELLDDHTLSIREQVEIQRIIPTHVLLKHYSKPTRKSKIRSRRLRLKKKR